MDLAPLAASTSADKHALQRLLWHVQQPSNRNKNTSSTQHTCANSKLKKQADYHKLQLCQRFKRHCVSRAVRRQC
jgi:hypothetical protein